MGFVHPAVSVSKSSIKKSLDEAVWDEQAHKIVGALLSMIRSQTPVHILRLC